MKNIDFHTGHSLESVAWLLMVEGELLLAAASSLGWSLARSVDSSSSVVTRNTRQHHTQDTLIQLLLPFLFTLSDPLSHQPAPSTLLIRNDLKSDLILAPVRCVSPLVYVNLDYVTLTSEPPLLQSKFWTFFWLLWARSRTNHIPLPIMF